MQVTPLNPGDPVSLGDFTLLGLIGRGGMGQVFLGESPAGEPAAVKVIRPDVVDSGSRRRFAQEIEVLKTVWGARLAAFLGADADAERPWLATEYVPGPDLGRQVSTHGPLSSLLTAALGALLAEALGAVHTEHLLHRDLKPANILLGPDGPKIIDFGLAAFAEGNVGLTSPHQVVGTPVCMAPEHAAGERPLSPAVDVYGLGAVLLYASTGHYPYEGATAFVVFSSVLDPKTAPDLSGAPAELLPLLTDMLAQNPADRPTTAEVVARCRGITEAQGMRIAQARRRLTALTAAEHEAYLPPSLPLGPVPAHEPAPAPAPEPEPLSAPVTEPLPMPAPAGSAPGEPEPAAGDPRQPWLPRERGERPTAPPPPHAPRPARTDRTVRALRSVTARNTAEQLRKVYAASAPF
ncbi:serine/threonine-protein kinase [Streptomyces sp. MJP52]|uniref:serine/threonine-protein kinase n=1 Tax=Streptomyces sp. MJP52 TaxID=2940555 RepID=UPI002474FC46|nr:serine/threonine-protein kinase [Streptomyces sp. MJP52]MDH6227841.1 serine/threonine protein kinase [Streptomyces sp. MJP52]